MRTPTRPATTELFDDVIAATAALDLIQHELGGVIIPEPQWRGFGDGEAYENLVRLDLEAAELYDTDW